MRRTAILAGVIVVFVVAGVTWSLAAHHGTPVPSVGGVDKVIQGINNLPKALPKVGKCLDGSDPTHIGKCLGRNIRIPGFGDSAGPSDRALRENVGPGVHGIVATRGEHH